MEKSKFGFNAVVYPLLVMFCVLFSQIWVGLAIFGFVLVMEKNEKISRMTLHAALWFFVWPLLTLISGQLSKFFFRYLPWQMAQFTDTKSLSYDMSKLFNNVSNIFAGIGSLLLFVYMLLLVLLGVLPLLAGKEMKLPFGKKADFLFGLVFAQAPPQYQQQYQQPQYQQQPQQYQQQYQQPPPPPPPPPYQ